MLRNSCKSSFMILFNEIKTTLQKELKILGNFELILFDAFVCWNINKLWERINVLGNYEAISIPWFCFKGKI